MPHLVSLAQQSSVQRTLLVRAGGGDPKFVAKAAGGWQLLDW